MINYFGSGKNEFNTIACAYVAYFQDIKFGFDGLQSGLEQIIANDQFAQVFKVGMLVGKRDDF
jgi:hypothetical protein